MRKTYFVVLVTTGNKQEAEKIVKQLLEERLIACGNIIGPISSIFHWSGEIEEAEEYLILMKSRKDLFNRLAETVNALHSYEVPEIVAFPIVEGSEAYLSWLDSCLAGQKKS